MLCELYMSGQDCALRSLEAGHLAGLLARWSPFRDCLKHFLLLRHYLLLLLILKQFKFHSKNGRKLQKFPIYPFVGMADNTDSKLATPSCLCLCNGLPVGPLEVIVYPDWNAGRLVLIFPKAVDN